MKTMLVCRYAAFAGVVIGSPAAILAQTEVSQGMVFDSVSGLPLAEARLALLSADGDDTVSMAESDALGLFRLTIPDAGTFLLAVTRDGYRPAPPLELTLPADATNGLLVGLEPVAGAVEVRATAATGSGPARLLGRVRDAETLRPVIGAEVVVGSAPDAPRAFTDGNGYFVLPEVPPGTERLTVRHLGYGEQVRPLEVDPGGSYHAEVTMRPEAVTLEGFRVEATSRAWFDRWDGLTWRMSRDLGGHFIVAEELERRGHPPLVSALRELPSIDIRNVRSNSPGSMGAEDPFNQRVFLRGCKASVWIDGIEVFNPGEDKDGLPAHLGEFLRVPTMDVEAIEVYPGGASLPPEFNNVGTMCALVIWTKRGGR